MVLPMGMEQNDHDNNSNNQMPRTPEELITNILHFLCHFYLSNGYCYRAYIACEKC